MPKDKKDKSKKEGKGSDDDENAKKFSEPEGAESDNEVVRDDDDEEEDGSDDNQYVKDGFVVDDDEVLDDEEEEEAAPVEEAQEPEKEHKHKKKRKKSEDLILDEDDLELIKENERTEKAGHRRLKKHKEIYRAEEENIEEGRGPEIEEEDELDEDDNFIERNESIKPTHKKTHMPYNYDLIQQVFGGQLEEIEEEEEKVEPEFDEEAAEERRKKKLKDIFDPAELQDRFVTLDDEKIIAQDIPERLQLRFRERPLPESQELVQETNWIAEKLKQTKNNVMSNMENLRKNIMKTLELLRVNHYEIMYIYTYKLNEISLNGGDLNMQDLWAIYDLDLEWATIYSRKKLLERKLENLEKSHFLPQDVKNLLLSSFDRYTLDNLYDYCDFMYSLHPDLENLESFSSDQKFKRPVRKAYLKKDIKEKLDDFANLAFLPVEKFVENLLGDSQFHSPIHLTQVPEVVAENVNDPKTYLIKDSLQTFTALCKYVTDQLYHHPTIRKHVKKLYFEKIKFSTEPTAKGKKEIDIYSPNILVKRINKMLISDIEPDIWLMALENEEKSLIKIKFEFPWSQGNAIEEYNKDEIVNKLKSLYIFPTSKHDDTITNQWNILRSEVIKALLYNRLYPHLEKVLRDEISQNSEKAIIEECGRKFKRMIFAKPYTKYNNDDENLNIRVLSFVVDDNGIVTAALVDGNGEFQDYMILNYLLIHPEKAPTEFLARHQKEKNELENFVQTHSPDLFVVGADNLRAQKLVKTIRDFQDQWKEGQSIWSDFGDMTAPKIYAKMELSKKEFRNFSTPLKEAISLARLQQSPLHEILKLWNHKNDENGILYMNFHHLQKNVSIERLKRELEKVAVECTNSVGVDINKILQHTHLQAPFQFICGLGPRKAKHILDTIFQNLKTVKMRSELLYQKIVDKNIYVNMSGFIIVKNDDQSLDNVYDLLDTTRIHPENYHLAKKIAKDSFDDAKDNEEEDYIEKIMEYPQKLEDLDLDDYAHHLESKGKQNMKIVLDFIVRELTYPFGDVRQNSTKMENQELFYKLTRETPFTLRPGIIVDVTIVRVKEQSLVCRLQCGKEVLVHINEIYEKNDNKTSIDANDYQPSMVVKARILHLSFNDSKDDNAGSKRDNTGNQKDSKSSEIKLSLKPNIVYGLNAHKKFHKEMIGWLRSHISTQRSQHINVLDKYLNIRDEDYPQQIDTSQVSTKYIPRKINHLKFKNVSNQGAIDFLAEREIGDFIIRPSSKGTDHLTITWKFYNYIYVHLDIQEQYKPNHESLGKKLILKDMTFDNLDDLIVGYIQPCNALVAQIRAHKKFVDGAPDAIESKLKQLKEEEPKTIPYLFGFSTEAPQYLVLYYPARGMEITKEYIKVKPKGLIFHENAFQNLNMLINWFKNNFKQPEYQKQLKHMKPPIMTQKNASSIVIKQEKIDSNYMHIETIKKDDYGDIRVKQEGIRVKDEGRTGAGAPGTGVKRENEKVCNTCGKPGHLANRCPMANDNQPSREDRSQRPRNEPSRFQSRENVREYDRHRDRSEGDRGDRSNDRTFNNNRNFQKGSNFTSNNNSNNNRGNNNPRRERSDGGGTGGGGFRNSRNNQNEGYDSKPSYDAGWGDPQTAQIVKQEFNPDMPVIKQEEGSQKPAFSGGVGSTGGNSWSGGGTSGGFGSQGGGGGSFDRERKAWSGNEDRGGGGGRKDFGGRERNNDRSGFVGGRGGYGGGRGGFNRSGPKTCSICHEEGHFARECPSGSNNNRGGGRRVERSRSRSGSKERRKQGGASSGGGGWGTAGAWGESTTSQQKQQSAPAQSSDGW